MRFLIYVPQTHIQPNDTPQETLTRVGLGEIAQGVDPLNEPSGPDGKGGRMFGWLDSQQADARYLPEQQTWLPSLRPGEYWVGVWNDSAPTETDLRRPDHRGGARIQLDNGETWAVATTDTLVRYPHPDPDNPGKIRWCVDETLNWLVTDVDKIVAERVVGKDDDAHLMFDPDADFDFFCRLLQINYRITPEIVMHLQLMSDQFINETMRALVRNRRGAA